MNKSQLQITKSVKPKNTDINWNMERAAAVNYGNKVANSNLFGIDNSIYNKDIKKRIKIFKGSYRNMSYDVSPEYSDLKLLLDICKDEGVKPLIISVPVNGMWYDYCGFSKVSRKNYYHKIRHIVKSFGFEIADFSSHEYDKYFLKDDQHIGYKGWVYVNEALVKYYNAPT